MSNITYEYIRRNKDIRTYISSADDALSSIGYTEHSLAHVERAADTAIYDTKHSRLPRKRL